MNSGNRNSGDLNSGDRNSGDLNSGDLNSGDLNSGHWNSGNGNSGNWNSGNGNSGNGNSGNRNSGDLNSGDLNSGDLNSGNWNSGNGNSGFFCTNTPAPTFFDLPVDMTWEEAYNLVPWVDLPVGCQWVPASQMTDEEKSEYTNHTTLGGYLKVLSKDIREAFPLAWAKLDDETKQRFLNLPNFDAEKFLAITGVDVREPVNESATVESCPSDEIVLNGVTYVRKQ